MNFAQKIIIINKFESFSNKLIIQNQFEMFRNKKKGLELMT